MSIRYILVFVLGVCSIGLFAQKAVYLDVYKPIEERVEDALQRMTIEEKVAVLHAQSKFSSAGVPRLGIPDNWATDGPHGIRSEALWDEWDDAKWTNDSCIAFPALTCLAATWNPQMAALYGKSIGEEARYRNKNILLGPGVNMYRTPLNGRNFEYMGEDPFLASRMVVPYVQEVQKNGVAACVKHFALNNQEVQRWDVDVVVDNRALHEIYLPAFKAAVTEGGAWAIMGAYNKYKGQHCCHNQYLLNDILKNEWKFDGVVVSDWGGTHDTWESVHNGLDMEFGTWTDGLGAGASNAYANYFLSDSYLQLLKEGKVGQEELNDKVRRILRMVFRTTMVKKRPFGSFGTVEHALVGRKVAEEGIVLLQNRNILPVDLVKVKKILVVGDNAVRRMTIGGGSSALKAKYEVSPLQGILKRVADLAEVNYVVGYEAPPYGVKETKVDRAPLRKQAVEAAKEADVVFFIGGLNKNGNQDCEGDDRRSYHLPYEQDQLIEELVTVNPNVVVVIISGNAVAMPWVNKVPAVLEAWYGGTEGGNALASILFGDVNPSGKLPFTIPVKLEDCPAHAFDERTYPGDGKSVVYSESIFTGYRWADKLKKVKPLFAFGHGLSYTTFQYDNFRANKRILNDGQTITFSVKVKNTGLREGKEVVQLYISDKKSSLPRPVKELKGFVKVALKPGEEKDVTITIGKEELSYFNDVNHEWVAEPGKFEAIIAASAIEIKGKLDFELR